MPYQRKYDFQPGTSISSSQVDEEFNNLITGVNNVEADLNTHKADTVPHLVTGERDKITNSLQGGGEKLITGIASIPDTTSTSLNVTFAQAFSSTPSIMVTLRSSSGDYKKFYVLNETTTGFTISWESPFSAITSRRFLWWVVGK